MAEEMTVAQKAAGWPAQAKDYFQELQLEMKRVTWPPWKQVRATTAVVIAAIFGFAAYFALVDAIVGRAVEKLFNTLTR